MVDRLPAVFQAFGGPKALRGNRHHRGERILDPVVQFLEHQTLYLVQDLLFSRIDTGLRQQAAEVHIFDLKPDFIFRSQGNLSQLDRG
jgi:hypothetical protein